MKITVDLFEGILVALYQQFKCLVFFLSLIPQNLFLKNCVHMDIKYICS